MWLPCIKDAFVAFLELAAATWPAEDIKDSSKVSVTATSPWVSRYLR